MQITNFGESTVVNEEDFSNILEDLSSSGEELGSDPEYLSNLLHE